VTVSPGTGKTHLAVAFGLKAVQQGYRTLFIAAGSLLTALTKAYSENRFEEKLKLYAMPKLLIIDEIGYVPVDRHAAHLFFQLITRRYERGSLIVTSNPASASGARSLATRLSRRRSWTESCTIASRSTLRASPSGCKRSERPGS
jgi:DNA replication protein DnaC